MDLEELDLAVGGGLTFHARAAGPPDGRLVLLLHGFPQTSRSWEAVMTALADAGCRAVAFDQRGYSPDARPPEVADYVVPHLVGDLLAVADEIGGHRFDLVGHDWGGVVAWATAGEYADRVRTLTVASTPHPLAFAAALRGDLGGDQPSKSGYADFFRTPEAEGFFLGNDAAALRGMYSALPPAAADEYVRVLSEPGAMTAALNWYRATRFQDLPDPGPITSPTLYVWSTDDMALGREAAEATGGHVAGPYRFEVLEGVSHWVPEEAAADFSRLLLDHLATHP
jgi:pimeloyl-ACP methyl ester carboxylesterase